MVWLPKGEKFLKICLFISTESTNVTDGQTPHDGGALMHGNYKVNDGMVENVNVNVNLYSASSQKAPLMRVMTVRNATPDSLRATCLLIRHVKFTRSSDSHRQATHATIRVIENFAMFLKVV